MLGQIYGDGAWVPGLEKPMPFYFSGTNAVATGECMCPALYGISEQFFVDSHLYVEGVEVKQWFWNIGEPKLTHAALAAVFDSSHFSNGSSVSVTIAATTNLGFVYSASNSATAINRIVGFNKPGFVQFGQNGTLELQNQMAGSNYDIDVTFFDG